MLESPCLKTLIAKIILVPTIATTTVRLSMAVATFVTFKIFRRIWPKT